MVTYLIIAGVCILAGGFGGYQWGAAVQRKAQAELNALSQGVAQMSKKL